jgi:hypothetical protein
MVVRDVCAGIRKVASYAEGKLFLVLEKLLLVIKLVLGGPGIVPVTTTKAARCWLDAGGGGVAIAAGILFGCGCRAQAATYRFEPGGSLP